MIPNEADKVRLLTKDDTQIYKAIAIVAVVMIHGLTLVPVRYLTESPWYLGIFAIDQFFRLSVPFFVIISGYGLGASYGGRAVSLREYYYKRFLKLVPLYLVWSLYLWWILDYISQWETYRLGESWPYIFLLGQAEYQLYFVPMLLSMYVIFPFVNRLRIHFLTIIVGGALIIQAVAYWWMMLRGWNDQLQNLMPLSWLGYFLFGVWLSRSWWSIKSKVIWISWIFVYLVLLSHSWYLFKVSNDLFIAMRQTKWSVIPYSLVSFLALIKIVPILQRVPGVLLVGRLSFIIFFAHTLALRFLQAPLNLSSTLLFIFTYGGLIVITLNLEYFKKKLESIKILSS